MKCKVCVVINVHCRIKDEDGNMLRLNQHTSLKGVLANTLEWLVGRGAVLFNRPGVAGAVPQTALSLIGS